MSVLLDKWYGWKQSIPGGAWLAALRRSGASSREPWLAGALGFVLAQAGATGLSVWPFGFSWLAALSEGRTAGISSGPSRASLVGGALGVIAGSLWSMPFSRALAESMATALYLILLLGSGRARGPANEAFHAWTRVAFPVGIVVLSSAPGGISLAVLPRAGLEAMLTVFLSAALRPACEVLMGKTFSLREGSRVVSSTVLMAGLLLGLRRLEIWGLGASNVFGQLSILVAALVGGSAAGAGTGAVVGLVQVLAGTGSPQAVQTFAGGLAFSGLLGGAFRKARKAGVCTGFAAGSLLMAVFERRLPVGTWPSVSEPAVAVLLFAFLNLRYLRILSKLTLVSPLGALSCTTDGRGLGGRNLSHRLRDIAGVFLEVGAALRNLGPAEARQHAGVEAFLHSMWERVCINCSGRKSCWYDNVYRTYWDMVALLASSEKLSDEELSGAFQADSVAGFLASHCKRLPELLLRAREVAETLETDARWREHVDGAGTAVSGQLEGLANVVLGLAEEAGVERSRSSPAFPEMAEQAALAFVANGIEPEEMAIRDLAGGIAIDVTRRTACAGKEHRECERRFAPLVSPAVGHPLQVRKICCPWAISGGRSGKGDAPECAFTLMPEPGYLVEAEVMSVPKDGGEVCGDAFSKLDLQDGRTAFLLSDGMGTGAAAAVQSHAAVSLLGKLLGADLELRFAVRLVNSVLVLQSPPESFVTLDVALVDPYRGTIEFVKIGSSPSFIGRTGGVDVVSANSLPVGILNSIEVEPEVRTIGHRDTLLMITDGVLDYRKESADRERWLTARLKRAGTLPLHDLAASVVASAVQRAGGRVLDDLTVVAVRFSRNTPGDAAKRLRRGKGGAGGCTVYRGNKNDGSGIPAYRILTKKANTDYNQDGWRTGLRRQEKGG